MSADVYSLTIIIFELFSGMNPFPGHIGVVFEAKRLDKKPAVPSNFPLDLKELVIQGWSKEPKERPQTLKFKSALNKMLTGDETERNQYSTLPEIANSSTEMQDSSSSILEEKSKSKENISTDATEQETNSPKEREEQSTPHEEDDSPDELAYSGEGNLFEGFIIAILWVPINGLVGLARSFHKSNQIEPYLPIHDSRGVGEGWEGCLAYAPHLKKP